MNEEKINIAVNILNNQIAKLTKELAFCTLCVSIA